MKKILLEASGSMVSSYMIASIQDAGHLSVASDISEKVVGNYLANHFAIAPKATDPDLWLKQKELLINNDIDIVFPSLDETLLGWSKRIEEFSEFGTKVIISPKKTIDIFTDKWKTYNFFKNNNIPTPRSSLTQDYPLIKPIHGRGAVGVRIEEKPITMTGLISQEVLNGTEYTVDVLCDFNGDPFYIIPRIRKGVQAGKSTQGQVKLNAKINDYVHKICKVARFHGPINLQCFEDMSTGEIKFIEINPRIAGGMALGFAASENWIDLIVNKFLCNKETQPKKIVNNLIMYRYFKEIFK